MKKNLSRQLVSYVLVAGFCFVLDVALFYLLSSFFGGFTIGSGVFLATLVARMGSSIVNYFLNRNWIFKLGAAKKIDRNSLINYYALVIVQLIVSAILTTLVVHATKMNMLAVKVVVDTGIFVVNFIIQKKYIFKSKTNILLVVLGKIRSNFGLVAVLVIYLVLHLLVLRELGVEYSLASDDSSYVHAGITFTQTGQVNMHGVISAQIMPLMNWLIGFLSLFFEGYGLWMALKITWLLLALASIVALYSILKLFVSRQSAALTCLLMLTPDFLWMNNTILTETPFVFSLLYLIFFSFKLEQQRSSKYLLLVTVFYLLAVLLKGNIAPYPVFLVAYFWLRGYDKKLLISQVAVAGAICCLFFVPWTIRNYKIFGDFIPLTYGGGNPLLLGTYQGIGFPSENPEEYREYARSVGSQGVVDFIEDKPMPDYKQKYYSLEVDGIIAKKRIRDWWLLNPKSFLKSYFVLKPGYIIFSRFYWRPVLGVSSTFVFLLGRIEFVLALVCLGFLLFVVKKHRAEILFIFVNYLFQVAVYSITFAFSRYHQTIVPLLFVGIGLGIGQAVAYWLQKRLKLFVLLIALQRVS